MKPALYIMCGLPFSGKTTLAKRIAEYTGSEQVAFDWIWYEKKKDLIPDMDKTEEWNFILNEAYKRIGSLLQNGKSVVYDDINVRKEHRDKLKRIADESKAKFVIVYLNIPMPVIREREAKNKNTKERHEVSEENFNKAILQFQQPVLVSFK